MSELYTLSVDECLINLESYPTRVGRVGFAEADGIAVLPVNYRYVGGEIVFHTTTGPLLKAAMMNDQVAFEVDDVDVRWKEGWSVMIRGKAREVLDPEESARLSEGLRSWADRDARTVAITPTAITGRRIA